jgi:prepilin-type N-terminal cleavage/methylation domain-containing protein
MRTRCQSQVASCKSLRRDERATCNFQPATGNFSHAFTLIEVIISSALMALILVSAYLCLNAGMAGKKVVEPRADIIQNARVALALLTADLRGACPLPADSAFYGMKRTLGGVEADNLDFATHHYTPRRAREGDFCEVSYYLEPDAATGRFSLWRRRNPTLAPDPLAGGSKEQIAQDVVGLRLEYSDGWDWYDTWGAVAGRAKAENSQREKSNLDGLPEAVRITLAMDSNPKSKVDPLTGERKIEPPLVFQTVAYLNLADASPSDTENSGGNSAGAKAANGGGN